MYTRKRSIELDHLAAEILAELGLEQETCYENLLPVVNILRHRSGCGYCTARAVMVRHMRKTHGLIFRSKGIDYRMVSVSELPHPHDAKPIPLNIIAPLEA